MLSQPTAMDRPTQYKHNTVKPLSIKSPTPQKFFMADVGHVVVVVVVVALGGNANTMKLMRCLNADDEDDMAQIEKPATDSTNKNVPEFKNQGTNVILLK